MKKLITLACLLMSTFVMSAENCAQVKYLTNDDVNKCLNSGAPKERISACSDARFFYAADFQACLEMKGKTEKIPKCARANFSYIEDFRNCIQ